MQQIALPLNHSEADEPSEIVLGQSNQQVAEALAQPGGWPFGTAILTGPPRSGKSLLGRWFGAQSDSAQPREVIDNADEIAEAELFHRWNRARESETRLLLIAQNQPWEIALPDLKSRLGAAMPLEIGPLDDAMAARLLESHAARRGLMLGDDAARYLLARMERSYSAIERIAGEIDRLSLERKSAPRMAIWRDALAAIEGPEQQRLP